jgi:hypothetical protein
MAVSFGCRSVPCISHHSNKLKKIREERRKQECWQKALLQSDMIVWRPLLPLLPHTGWFLNCVSLDAPPPMSCGSKPWVAMPTIHSSPIIWCVFEYIPLSQSLAASPITFLPISSDRIIAVNIDLRHQPITGATMLVLLPPLPVTPRGWLLSKRNKL